MEPVQTLLSLEASPVRRRGVGIALSAVLVGVGLFGTARDLLAYWRYRGFPPPITPSWVHERGTLHVIRVPSPAIDRSQAVYVFLPPGYAAHPLRRYPVFYLLHGYPGEPVQFLNVGQVGVQENVLVALHKMAPTILVMPYGTTRFLTDKEWTNGVGRDNGWETFLVRDVVDTIDARYRTIVSGAGRAIGGLSEGGYAALNVAFHHPGEFGVVESWSGYTHPLDRESVFGDNSALIAYNSPVRSLSAVADQLRLNHVFVWFYVGSDDSLLRQNQALAWELNRLHVWHRFLVVHGEHSWVLWRAYMPQALLAASSHLAHG